MLSGCHVDVYRHSIQGINAADMMDVVMGTRSVECNRGGGAGEGVGEGVEEG